MRIVGLSPSRHSSLATRHWFIAMDRKKLILFVLLGIFAVTLTYRVMHPYKQARVSDRRSGPRGGAHKGADKADKGHRGVDLVMVDAFLNPPPHQGEASRDIFAEKKEVVAVPPPALEKTAAVAAAQPVAALPEDPRAQLNKDLSGIKVFGSYKRGKENGLFLERGKEILVIHVGDRIDGKYLVKDITDKGITLRAEAINEDVHIDLSDF